jgi:hypothetical protein
MFFTPIGDVLMGLFGLVSIYSLLPIGLYVLAILRNEGLHIVLLFNLVVSVLSMATFSALVGTNGTLTDGGHLGHIILKMLYIALSEFDIYVYWWIFSGSLGLTFIGTYSLYVFAKRTVNLRG